MSKWHEVKTVEGEDGQDWLEVDGRTEWCVDTSVESVERYIAAMNAKLKRAKIIAEYKRRESAEREQAAKDAELDRRAKVARQVWVLGLSKPPIMDATCRWRDVVRALDADAAERGEA